MISFILHLEVRRAENLSFVQHNELLVFKKPVRTKNTYCTKGTIPSVALQTSTASDAIEGVKIRAWAKNKQPMHRISDGSFQIIYVIVN